LRSETHGYAPKRGCSCQYAVNEIWPRLLCHDNDSLVPEKSYPNRRVLSIHEKLDGLSEFLSCLWLVGGFEIPLDSNGADVASSRIQLFPFHANNASWLLWRFGPVAPQFGQTP
jgi:hypothetical protein